MDQAARGRSRHDSGFPKSFALSSHTEVVLACRKIPITRCSSGVPTAAAEDEVADPVAAEFDLSFESFSLSRGPVSGETQLRGRETQELHTFLLQGTMIALYLRFGQFHQTRGKMRREKSSPTTVTICCDSLWRQESCTWYTSRPVHWRLHLCEDNQTR